MSGFLTDPSGQHVLDYQRLFETCLEEYESTSNCAMTSDTVHEIPEDALIHSVKFHAVIDRHKILFTDSGAAVPTRARDEFQTSEQWPACDAHERNMCFKRLCEKLQMLGVMTRDFRCAWALRIVRGDD